ncbi:hypothetical protein CTI12_AA547540 [Artemisia annua]|uniref:Uncharacterized protein n=1 Tax=Artemisia annua TaxID=35608 RepID=A0A2U1KZA4_ARTAN|nr:hypothetical protein CTI12_AA547540 [Artemisia annua]
MAKSLELEENCLSKHPDAQLWFVLTESSILRKSGLFQYRFQLSVKNPVAAVETLKIQFLVLVHISSIASVTVNEDPTSGTVVGAGSKSRAILVAVSTTNLGLVFSLPDPRWMWKMRVLFSSALSFEVFCAWGGGGLSAISFIRLRQLPTHSSASGLKQVAMIVPVASLRITLKQ